MGRMDQLNIDIVTRFAVHGFHGRLCREPGSHKSDDTYMSLKCTGNCDTYHNARCPLVPFLGHLANLSN